LNGFSPFNSISTPISASTSAISFRVTVSGIYATLRAVAVRRPSGTAELDGTSGIGAKKLDAYGEALVRVVAEYAG
jgi:hypothetical protein